MTRYLTYRRLSFQEARSQSVSLSWQQDQCAAWIARQPRGEVIPFVDDGVSGGVPLGARDDGKKLLAEIAKGDCVVVTAKLDRMFRNVADAALRCQEWLFAGVPVAFVCEGLDTTTIAGRLTFHILAAVAQAERETIGFRISESTKARKRQGLRLPGPVPYGFREVHEASPTSASGEVVRIVRDEGEQKVIEKMKDLRRRGKSWRGIAAALEDARIPTRTGKPWAHMTVKGILLHGKHRTTKRRPVATSDGEDARSTERGPRAGGEDSE